MALITLEQAAEILGITTDELVEMRERNEIHGYRDGSSWKFKEDEVQRVKSEMGDAPSLDADDEDASILVSEEELGQSSDGSLSTIIGKNGTDQSAPESDLELSEAVDSGELKLTPDSNLELTGGSETGSGDDLNLGSSLESGDLDLASDLALGSGELSLDDDDELALGEDDDDLVLGGSGSLESDITLGSATDTGINLLSPSDSGLSLEEEPGLGTDIGSLELPEDEEDIVLGSDSELQPDDEFMLSQPDEMTDDDDSGSQVIALEESSAFDQDAATMLQAGEQDLLSEDPAAEGGFGADLDSPAAAAAAALAAGAVGGADLGAAVTPVEMGAADVGAVGTTDMPMPAAPTVTEAPYSLLNVLGLLAIILCLSLAGMLMVDVARNMWAWQEGYSVSTGMTDGIIAALGLNN